MLSDCKSHRLALFDRSLVSGGTGRVGVLRWQIILVSTLVVFATSLAGCSQAGPTAAVPPDSSGIVWLCRPGIPHDPCTASLKTTVVEENGSKHIVDYEPARNPAVDCFYVYPNITHQQTDNANLDVDPQETAIAELEASPFSRACRVYAPMYRDDSGKSSSKGPYQVAIDSVEAAWTDYIEHYNVGRGFVLIGHSEGTGLLGHLIIDRIEHNPTVRQRLVSALLIGGNLPVRTNGLLLFKDQQIQPCRSDAQTGCVIGYDSFSAPPPSDSMFGRQPSATLAGYPVETLCTNPASLSGGSGTLESQYRTPLPTQDVAGSTTDGIFASDPPTSATPWIEFDGQYSARCVQSNGANVLMVTALHHAPALTAAPSATFGLHLDDPNVALGNLVAIVQSEANAYVGAHPLSQPTVP
jgi:Protein of unknown function (DUF3089)